MVQWLRIDLANAGDVSSIPGWATRATPQLLSPHTAMKDPEWYNEVNKQKKIFLMMMMTTIEDDDDG